MICFYFYIQCREATILYPPQHENEFPFTFSTRKKFPCAQDTCIFLAKRSEMWKWGKVDEEARDQLNMAPYLTFTVG